MLPACGQVIVTGSAGVTVKVALQVLVTSQELVTVQVTVFDPPQAEGAPLELLVIWALQPPVKEAVASHSA